MLFDQSEFDIRCEWGEKGVLQLAPVSDAIIIVDVMSFSTAVTVATSRGATVFPYRWNDESPLEYAKSVNAVLAGGRGESQYSLSPVSLMTLRSGSRIVLPSPNGSTLTLATGKTPTLAGCLRNCQAVAQAAQSFGNRISVIASGERWKDDSSLRPAYEDLLGAGAVISYLKGNRSPEAETAEVVFQHHKSEISARLKDCSSGKELIECGFEGDIEVIASVNCNAVAPFYFNGAYVGK